MLLNELLEPMGLTQREYVLGIRVPHRGVNELLNGRGGVMPGTALRLSKFFGNSAGFWLNLQQRWDLYHAQQEDDRDLKRIKTIKAAG